MKRLMTLTAAAALAATVAAPALAQGLMPPDTGGIYNMQDPSTFGGETDSRPYSGGSIGHIHNRPLWSVDAYAYAPDVGTGGEVYRSTGFLPADIAAETVGGAIGIAGAAVNTAGAIATAPLRAGMASEAYAAMDNGNNSCAQRFRSYDAASGTYLGYDGKRHVCR